MRLIGNFEQCGCASRVAPTGRLHLDHRGNLAELLQRSDVGWMPRSACEAGKDVCVRLSIADSGIPECVASHRHEPSNKAQGYKLGANQPGQPKLAALSLQSAVAGSAF